MSLLTGNQLIAFGIAFFGLFLVSVLATFLITYFLNKFLKRSRRIYLAPLALSFLFSLYCAYNVLHRKILKDVPSHAEEAAVAGALPSDCYCVPLDSSEKRIVKVVKDRTECMAQISGQEFNEVRLSINETGGSCFYGSEKLGDVLKVIVH
jgi:hypothetical protein